MTDADVIVLDLDGGEMLQRCVDSLAAQTLAPSRVVVLDNGSADPVGRRLRRDPRAVVEIAHSPVNLGFAAGVNEAIRHTRAPYVALVNNDVILDADWLETMVGALDGDDTLAAVQSVIRRDATTIDGAGIDISDGTIRQAHSGSAIGTVIAAPWGVSATAALYRRSAIGEKPFDPRFFAYYEDVALCARLLHEGWTFALVTEPKALHEGSKSASKLGARSLYLRTRNRYWVARMFPGVGQLHALLLEDAKLALRGRTSIRGVFDGLRAKL